MTLVVAMSRADDYVLMTCDSAVFMGEISAEVGEWEIASPEDPPKVTQLSPYVLAATIGDEAISRDFLQRLGERVGQSDYFEECADAARTVIAELKRDDAHLAGSLYTTDGRVWKRFSLMDRHAFTFVLSGFGQDGETAMLVGTGETLHPIDETNGQRIAISCPYGIDESEVLAFYNPEDSSLAGAFGHAFAVHHYLGAEHADRVSRDIRFRILARNGALPDPFPITYPFELDRTDVEAARAKFNSLVAREEWTCLAD